MAITNLPVEWFYINRKSFVARNGPESLPFVARYRLLSFLYHAMSQTVESSFVARNMPETCPVVERNIGQSLPFEI